MKNTCMNCKKYYAILISDDGLHHVHDWCDQWKTVLNAYALAEKMDYKHPFIMIWKQGRLFAICLKLWTRQVIRMNGLTKINHRTIKAKDRNEKSNLLNS